MAGAGPSGAGEHHLRLTRSAGLDAVAPGVVQQPVVRRHGDGVRRGPGDHPRLRADEVAEARVPHGVAAELREVARRHVVAGDGLAAAVDEVGVLEPQCGRPAVHERHEAALAAADRTRQREGGVVGALDHERVQGLANGDAVADPEPDGDARLAGH